jgi:iron(III) transport system substrate-binding protein
VKVRSVVTIGLALAMAGMVCGCGSSGTSSTSPSATASATASATSSAAAFGGAANAQVLEALYHRAIAANQHSVVIYGPSAGTDAVLYQAFQKSFPGITVTGVPVVGPPMTAKVSAEMSSGKHVADIAYTGSTDMLLYTKQGWLIPFTPATAPPASQLAAQAVGPGNAFYGFSDAVAGMVYNTNTVTASEVPQQWTGFLDPKWKGKLAMYDPTAIGEMEDIFAHLALIPGDTGVMAGLKAQGAQLSPSTSITGPLNAVAQGAKSIALGIAYAFYKLAKAGGAPVAFTLLKSDNYTVILYGGQLKGAPHPLASQLYEDWLYTPQAATAIAAEGAYSTVLGATAPQGLPALASIPQMPVIPLEGIIAADNASIAKAQRYWG